MTPELTGWAFRFAVASGVFWSLAYVLMIRVGFKHKTFCMPLFALCLNLAWEFTYSFVYPMQGQQEIVDVVWFGLDLIILVTYVLYGRQHLPSSLPRWLFVPNLLLTLGVMLTIIIFAQKLDPELADEYTAFGQNLLMSILFIHMLISRGSTEGQGLPCRRHGFGEDDPGAVAAAGAGAEK